MTMTKVGVLAIWLSGSMLPLAQAPSPTKADAPQKEQEEIKAIGCLVRADTSAWRTGTTGSPKGDRYRGTSTRLILKDVAVGADATPEGSARSRREFGLQSDTVKLDSFVDQLIEVTGRVIAGEPAKDAGKSETRQPAPPRTLNEGGNDILATAVRSLKPKC